jgi:protein tyrosine/serine phosphatase
MVGCSVVVLTALATGCARNARRSASIEAGPPAASADAGRPSRDPRWAVPVERPGLPNLYMVSRELYRGAQPEPEGFRELQRMGVRTVVNLRSFHSDRDEFEEAGLADSTFAYEHIWMKAWHPEDEEVVRFLRIATDPARAPVFVHCQHGADRTGTMAAVYRIAVQGWTKEEAIREMTRGGFGYHEIWKGLPEYVRELDVERISREAGLDE